MSPQVAHTAASLVSAEGGDRQTLAPFGLRIANSTLHDTSYRCMEVNQPALRIAGVGITVAQNEVYDAPMSAILFGGNDQNISLNTIHDVLLQCYDVSAPAAARFLL